MAWSLAAVAAALAIHYVLLAPYLRIADNDFDALHLYLPLANRLVADGLKFFADPRSIQAPPFSYAWAALLGRSLPAIKLADAALSGVTMLLACRIAWLAHSRAAAMAVAILFAASPLMRPFLAAPITEPPFLLFGAMWMWGFAEWHVAGRRWGVWLGAFALALATLTRATLFYWMLALVIAFAWIAWRSRRHDAFIAHAAALVLPLCFIAKNAILFGFPFFATGAGNALYLGNNPVTGGYDPNYLGLMFDVGSIARDQSSLTLEAERLLGGVARFMIREQDPAFLAAMHLKKLAAFVFVTDAERAAVLLRSWRIATLVLAAVGLWAMRDRWLRALLAGILLYQVAVLVPMLYTHRYSVGAMDLWLTILAGIGVAALVAPPRRTALAIVAAMIVAGGALGAYENRHFNPPQPDVFRAARIPIWSASPVSRTVGPEGATIDLQVDGGARGFDPANNYALVIEASISPSASCSPLNVSYRREPGGKFTGPVPRRVRPDGSLHRLQWGFAFLDLNAPGTLRIELRCNTAATLQLARVAVYAPMGSIDFRERYLGEPPLFPGAFERSP